MKRTLVLGFALTALASAAFAAPQQESVAPQASQSKLFAENGSEHTLQRLHKQTAEQARVAENGSDRTLDRLHKQLGEQKDRKSVV